ncbi:MAG: hypothetical protein WC615_16015 [Mucilaginibacter sp.]|uniref:restriction system modified-DNA reader domain-containing protein n=1 Tax=Mucilaginibacter sp. TaxID=1882438 RepID=UPI003569E997
MNYLEQEDITLEMVIKAGLLKPGTTVYAASDSNITGTLNADGSIELTIDGTKKVFPYPSGAARAVRNISVSGWVFWKVKENGQLTDLLKYKQRLQIINGQ